MGEHQAIGSPRRDIAERSFAFAVRVIRLCRSIEKTSVNRSLAAQLLRSATSIGANVEEAQGSQSKADFVSKMSIACKESRETHYWLRLFAAAEIFPHKRLSSLEDECNQLVAILTTIIKNTKAKKD